MKSKFYKIAVLSLLLCVSSCTEKKENIKLISTHIIGFEHPTQVLVRGDSFIVAEMRKPLLYSIKNLDKVSNEDKTVIGGDNPIAIKSPHFMAALGDKIFVTEGRGGNVVFYSMDRNYQSTKLFNEEVLNRPHGICIDKKGWIYIADSVNSRLVRIHSETRELQAFSDKQNRIAYGRQLLCRDDGIWLSNSYEKAFKLNPGTGSNVLKISNFESGESEVILEYKDTNTTGLAILDNRYLVIGRWSGKYDVVLYDLKLKQEIRKLYSYDKALDAPYGITVDEENRKFYIAFLGLSKGRGKNENGGVKVFSY